MNIKIRAIERRWFDDFGQFCTYLLKHAVIDEIVDEDDLVWRITKMLRDDEVHPDNIDDVKERIVEAYGIADEYVGLILDKVRNELRAYEEELHELSDRKVLELEEWMDRETFRRIMIDVQKMYFELNYEKDTIIKEIALTYGLTIEEAREVLDRAENYIFM